MELARKYVETSRSGYNRGRQIVTRSEKLTRLSSGNCRANRGPS
jgi:hypothetical protein